MPNPNVIVGRVQRFHPPLEGDLGAIIRSERGLVVDIGDGGRSIRLDPDDPRSPGYAQVLAELARLERPVYVEIDPVKGTLTKLFVPHVSRVHALNPDKDGRLDVALEHSHARHTLMPSEDFAAFQMLLRDALEKGTVLIVSEDDARILDIRAFRPGPDGPLPPMPKWPPRPRPPTPWLDWLYFWRWKIWPWMWFGCISMTRAQKVFDDMNATSCAPLTVPAPCIPFLYPVDGCFARAHEMCRLMLAQGLKPRKVWIQSIWPNRLHVNTRNRPNCFVEWGWHVAPTLCVRRWLWYFIPWRVTMVIDPSLFTSPVTEATWKSVQGDPSATLTDTDMSWFFYFVGATTDPSYSLTNSYLAQYRAALMADSITYGPPPYANCP